MITHKRDRKSRAFNHGYRIGLEGKSQDICPYSSVFELRGFWLSGWREGRDMYLWGAKALAQKG